MAEYIERNKMLDDFELCNKQNPRWTPQRVKSLIVRANAADVVEVVRCRDCVQWYRNCGYTNSPNGHCFTHDIEMNGNDFCSYGTRKGDVASVRWENGRCSNCGQVDFSKPNYCPSCGARMV